MKIRLAFEIISTVISFAVVGLLIAAFVTGQIDCLPGPGPVCTDATP